jgi:uncharacterized protein (DUF1684 family)
MNTLEQFRKEKDDFFKNNHQSPLSPEQRRSFTALHYYPENPSLRLNLKLKKGSAPVPVIIQTSTGEVREYMRVGEINFNVNGQDATLQIYDDGNSYFLPFVDATAPDETYGAGRYLEPQDLGNDMLEVDFNLAYNPYCAYNERWSCPLPPNENRLKVRIEAGEKKLHD